MRFPALPHLHCNTLQGHQLYNNDISSENYPHCEYLQCQIYIESHYCVFPQQVVSGQTVQQVVSGQQIQTVASAQQTQQVVAAQPSLVTVPAATATTQVKPPTPLNQAVPAPPSSTNASADTTAPVSFQWYRKICPSEHKIYIFSLQ